MTRPAASIEDVSLRLGAFALRNIRFALEAGEIVVILGPNGAGKSVLLETIAGFHLPASGRIIIQGRDVTALPPEKRRVGFIFQNFGLFPNMTVEENIAFGLRAYRSAARKGGPAPSAAEVGRLIARFGLEGLARRSPLDLSPGEKQRVALARSLATHPDVFLLDEPFSALDARTGEALREELRLFLRETGIPAIFVSHDHLDALILADKVVVMQKGGIVQIGAAPQVFRKPVSRFVAEFLGVENILLGSVAVRQPDGCRLEIAGRTLYARAEGAIAGETRAVCVCIRAEDVRIGIPGGEAAPDRAGWRASNRLTGPIASLTSVGPLTRIVQDCGFPLVAYVMNRQARDLGLHPGVVIASEVDADAIHLVADA